MGLWPKRLFSLCPSRFVKRDNKHFIQNHQVVFTSEGVPLICSKATDRLKKRLEGAFYPVSYQLS
jgi:hypothetical protein